MGSTPPAAFAPRPDDDDDVRWALSTALVQWNRGGRADAVVWLRRAGEAADASGAPARATELRRHAAELAETLWSQPPPAPSDEIDVLIEVEGERKAPLPPPPAAVRMAQGVAANKHPSLPPLSTHPDERQSIAELGPQRQHFASAPEIVLEEEPLDASELEEILDYVGEDELEVVEPAVSSRGSERPSFNDRLSSASVPPLAVEAVLPVRASSPDLLDEPLVLDRLSDTDTFSLEQRDRPPTSERAPAVALPIDDDGGVEDFDDRPTMVPLSSEAEAVRVASARSRPPAAGRIGDSEPTELLDGEEALAIDGDLRESYRPESIDLGADWAPIESERGPAPDRDLEHGSASFDADDAFGSVSVDSDAADLLDRQTRDGVLADGFEAELSPRSSRALDTPEPPSVSVEVEMVPLSSLDAELGGAALRDSEVPVSLAGEELVPASGYQGQASTETASEFESLPPIDFASDPPEALVEVRGASESPPVLDAGDVDSSAAGDVPQGSALEEGRTEGAVFGLDEAPPSRAVPPVVSTRRGLSDRAAAPDPEQSLIATDDALPVESSVPLEVEPVESVVAEELSIESVSAEEVVSIDDAVLLEEVASDALEGSRVTSGAPPPPPRRSARAAALGAEDVSVEAGSVEAGSVEAGSVEEQGPVTLASASSLPPASEEPATTLVDGIDLSTARGFEDLPEDVQRALARLARVETLEQGEEVGMFGAAIITSGQVSVLPAFADESGAMATESDVIFTHGTLEDSIALRVVSKVDGTRVAVWDPQPLAEAIADCPWVHDELRLIADRFLALCGATLGPLGDRLDESLRSAVFQRLEVRTFSPGEELTTEGKALPGLFVIGGGRVDIVKGGEVKEQKSPGEFLFATAIMGGSKSPATARAGDKGALALFASRAVAHELMISVPPLLEVLAG